MSIYRWHIDFDGTGGLVIADNSEEAVEILYEMYDFSDFQKEHLNLVYHHRIDYDRLERELVLQTKFTGTVKRQDKW